MVHKVSDLLRVVADLSKFTGEEFDIDDAQPRKNNELSEEELDIAYAASSLNHHPKGDNQPK